MTSVRMKLGPGTGSWFEWATRPDGERFVRLMDGAPEELSDAVRDAHGELLPNDSVYELCRAVWGWLVTFADECDGDLTRNDLPYECADDLLDGEYLYNTDRADWFHSDPLSWDFCDEWLEMDPGDETTTAGIIAGGLWLRLRFVCECLGPVARDLVAGVES